MTICCLDILIKNFSILSMGSCLGCGEQLVLTQTDSHRFVPLLGFRKGLKEMQQIRYQEIIGISK